MTTDATSAPRFLRWTRRHWALTGVLLVFVAMLWSLQSARNRLSALPELRTVNMQTRDIRITIGTTGTIEPTEVVEVGALVSGTVIGFGNAADTSTKPIDVGVRVAQGAIMARLDRQPYEIALRKAKATEQISAAQVARLEILLRQAKRDLQRAERLRATNSESAFDKIASAFYTAQADLEISRARREQAMAEVEQAETNLARTIIYAPIDGIVIDSRVNLGQSVNTGKSGLFLLAHDLDHMRIRASVSETDIGKIYSGQSVSFTVDSDREQVFRGHVANVLLNARVQNNFVTYDVLIDIDGSTDKLLPHMTADVEFEIEQRQNAWLVPGESLRWWPSDEQIVNSSQETESRENRSEFPAPKEGDLAYIWVPAGDRRVRSIRVRVGINDGVRTEVSGDGFLDQMPVVVGAVRETTLARLIPSVKTFR